MTGFFDSIAADYDRIKPTRIEMYEFCHGLLSDLILTDSASSYASLRGQVADRRPLFSIAINNVIRLRAEQSSSPTLEEVVIVALVPSRLVSPKP